MASYHCTVRVGGAGKGAAHASYIAREGKYETMLERRAGERLEHVEHGNMPTWATSDPLEFWKAADERERKGGAVYREIEVALPREMTVEQRRELVQNFVRQEIGDWHAFTYAIHLPKASLEGGEQPHAHIMWSERTVDNIERGPDQYFKRWNAKAPEKGGCQKDSAGTKERLQATRSNWADVQNEHLARHGHPDRVTHLSLKEQGIAREPEQHLGPKFIKSLGAEQVADLLAARAAEGERERAQATVSRTIDVSGSLAAAILERDQVKQGARNELAGLANNFRANFAATKSLEKAANEFKAKQAIEQQTLRDRAAKAEQEKVRRQELENAPQPKRQERDYGR